MRSGDWRDEPGGRRVAVTRPARLRERYVRLRLRSASAWQRLPALPIQVGALMRKRRAIGDYVVLDQDALRQTRRSDTLFIFGSGASLNELRQSEWETIAKHDTLGFNWFVHERFVRCDYQLLREITSDDRDRSTWMPELTEYAELIRTNDNYAETVFLVQSGLRATNSNRVIGYRLLPPGARLFPWRTRVFRRELSRSLDAGLTHGYGTLGECINFGYLLGWRRIVLVGVDLYDRRYFWLERDAVRTPDALRGAEPGDRHATAVPEMIALLGEWADELAAEGVELSVQNPRSLLAGVLPVCDVGSLKRAPA